MLNLTRLLFPLCALIALTGASSAYAETKMVGHLSASNPCMLQAVAKEAKNCIEVTIPIGGTVTITSESGARKRVRVTAKGIFATRLKPGSYTIELADASISGNPIDSHNLKLSTRHLTVGKTSFRVRYEVAHKDHFPHVLVGPVM